MRLLSSIRAGKVMLGSIPNGADPIVEWFFHFLYRASRAVKALVQLRLGSTQRCQDYSQKAARISHHGCT